MNICKSNVSNSGVYPANELHIERQCIENVRLFYCSARFLCSQVSSSRLYKGVDLANTPCTRVRFTPYTT